MSNNPKKTSVDMHKFWKNIEKNSNKMVQTNNFPKIKPSVTVLKESVDISNKDNK